MMAARYFHMEIGDPAMLNRTVDGHDQVWSNYDRNWQESGAGHWPLEQFPKSGYTELTDLSEIERRWPGATIDPRDAEIARLSNRLEIANKVIRDHVATIAGIFKTIRAASSDGGKAYTPAGHEFDFIVSSTYEDAEQQVMNFNDSSDSPENDVEPAHHLIDRDELLSALSENVGQPLIAEIARLKAELADSTAAWLKLKDFIGENHPGLVQCHKCHEVFDWSEMSKNAACQTCCPDCSSPNWEPLKYVPSVKGTSS
jgi:hypothetical protein